MGHHYTPQKHLSRFECSERKHHIWQYDKSTGNFSSKPLSIKEVAQEKGYYPEDIETSLNFNVEIPANRCIEKILRRETPNWEESHDLAAYIITMASRGPLHRKKNNLRLKRIFDETLLEVKPLIMKAFHGQLREKKLIELAEIKFDSKNPQIERLIKTPFQSNRAIECIKNMCWEIAPAPESMQYITGDTPAHFFEGIGIGRVDSELTITLSKNIALIGHHRHSPRTINFRKPNRQITMEINRRMISASVRFIYVSKPEDWIRESTKKNLRLNNIWWKSA